MKTTTVTNTQRQQLTLSVTLKALGVHRGENDKLDWSEHAELKQAIDWFEDASKATRPQHIVKGQPDRIDIMIGSKVDVPGKAKNVPMATVTMPVVLLQALAQNPLVQRYFQPPAGEHGTARLTLDQRVTLDKILKAA